MLSEEQIAELERLHKHATAGTWYREKGGYIVYGTGRLGQFERLGDSASTVALHNNAEALIADWRAMKLCLEEITRTMEIFEDPMDAAENAVLLARQTLELEEAL